VLSRKAPLMNGINKLYDIGCCKGLDYLSRLFCRLHCYYHRPLRRSVHRSVLCSAIASLPIAIGITQSGAKVALFIVLFFIQQACPERSEGSQFTRTLSFSKWKGRTLRRCTRYSALLYLFRRNILWVEYR
jgi:hypothetical protein